MEALRKSGISVRQLGQNWGSISWDAPSSSNTHHQDRYLVRILLNLYFPLRLREHPNLNPFSQTTAHMDVFPRYFPSSYGGPLPSDVLKCEGPSVTPKRGVLHRSLTIFMQIYADPNT